MEYLGNYYIRKKYWPINAVISAGLRLSKPFRNPKIWVFGTWEGKRYDDNSKILFEYVLKNRKDLNPYWITRSPEIVRLLEEKGYPVLLDSTREAKKILKSAGVAFYTNGLDDFSPICYLYGACLINLTHASSSIKKTGTEINNYQSFPMKKYLKRIKDKIFYWYKFDYLVATSELSGISKTTTYHAPKEKAIITGMPRNDVLFQEHLDKQKILQMKNANQYSYILIMPTYRLYNNTVVSDLVAELTSNTELNKVLRENKFKILIKLHNVEPQKFESEQFENVVILDNSKVECSQELLAISDVLVTDYSSCMIDFAIMNRPIVIYASDFDEYNANTGVIDEWEKIYNSDLVVKTPEILSRCLMEIIQGNSDTSSIINILNDMYYDPKIRNTCFCRNVTEFVAKLLGE